MKKSLSLFLCFLILISIFLVPVFADDEIKITIDVNQRYTDIYEKDDDDIYLKNEEYEKEKQERESRKTIYVIVLLVLLAISVGVLIYTLKKSPDEEEIKEELKQKNQNKTRLQKDIGDKVNRENRKKEDSENKKDKS